MTKMRYGEGEEGEVETKMVGVLYRNGDLRGFG